MRALVRFVVVLAVLAVLAGGAAAWMGVLQVPVLSSQFGMDRPRDLGPAQLDAAAYAAFSKRLGVQLPSSAANYSFSSRHEFSGSVPVDETIPESTILAIREFQTDTPGLRDVSIRFHAGSAEAAAFIDLAPYGYPLSGPVYASFRVAVAGPKRVTVALDALDFGRLGVPGDIRARAEDALNGYLTTRLAQIEGLKIATLAFHEGAVEFAGTLPTTYDTSPPKPGAMP
jgi:hypothetical protein